MADPVLVSALVELKTKAEIQAIRTTVLEGYLHRIENVTVIIGKSSESDSATGQVVVSRDDYREWLAATEEAIAQKDATEAGEGVLLQGASHVDFSKRFITT